jgi:mono/diheme cytochrome c family protein
VSAKPTWVRVAAHALPFLALSACSWFTDFKQQPKIDPWETAADSIPFRGNPQGSVPTVGSVAPGFQYDRSASPGSITAMAGLVNPVSADSASVNRGRINYQINCAVCHGPAGMGNGPATKYGMPGMGIGAGSNAANRFTDGYIFGMIRNGRGVMPPYNRIEEPDRWDIVNYLRTLQGKGTIAADTTHGFPGQNGATVPSATHFGPTRPSPYYHPGTSGAAGMPASVGGMPTLPAVPAAAPTHDSTKKTPTDSTKKPEQSL